MATLRRSTLPEMGRLVRVGVGGEGMGGMHAHIGGGEHVQALLLALGLSREELLRLERHAEVALCGQVAHLPQREGGWEAGKVWYGMVW